MQKCSLVGCEIFFLAKPIRKCAYYLKYVTRFVMKCQCVSFIHDRSLLAHSLRSCARLQILKQTQPLKLGLAPPTRPPRAAHLDHGNEIVQSSPPEFASTGTSVALRHCITADLAL